MLQRPVENVNLWRVRRLLHSLMLLHLLSATTLGNILQDLQSLPVIEQDVGNRTSADFLIDPSSFQTRVGRNKAGTELVIDNGLLRRSWRVAPNGACVGFDNLMTAQSMLRSVRPEARVTIDGIQLDVGGLVGQPNHAFLRPDWLQAMQADPKAMKLTGFHIGKPTERIAWNRRRHASPNAVWPPQGAYLRMDYVPPPTAANKNVRVSVHYELYDGIPAMNKWITVHNDSEEKITVDRFRGEELAVVEQANWVELRGEGRDAVRYPVPDYLHVETDFAFGGFNHQNANRHAVRWENDPLFTSQVNYRLQTPCLLIAEPTYGPAQDIPPGEQFESFRTFELVYDHGNRERRGLIQRKMYRTLAPWATENPITHHLLSSKPEQVKQAIDNAVDVGFEAVLLSFGSGFNMESTDPEYLQRWKLVADYAEQQDIELGAYSLFSSRSVGGGNDVVSPAGLSPKFGKAPAATSAWGIDYFAKLQRFYDETGFDQFENDGPYPGDVDVTPRPPYQKGEQDSRWAQWKIVANLYKHLRATGVYINQPDYYFFNGGNKTGMGYREVNWSLPREQQLLHTRQNIYDGSWTKTPSMGWMFVPLAQYHGGGAAATVEPLEQHLDHYHAMMRANLGMGVQAHYRGPRLFDTDVTREMVKRNIAWFKKYRNILESDIIHGRRADGRDLDWILHANPELENRGMLCVYNPLDREVTKKLTIDLYYTGLTESAEVQHEEGATKTVPLDRKYQAAFDVVVPTGGMTWYVIR